MNTTNALATLANNDQRMAQVIDIMPRLRARFPQDCNEQQAREVAMLAVEYGLDPFLGELVPFQGRPYITIAGMIRVAERNPAFDGYEDDIVWGDKLKQLQQYPNEVVWECTVYRKDRRRPVRAYGRAGGPYDDKQFVAKQRPLDMAQKRAIHRALRAAFPIPIPGFEEVASVEQLRAIHAYDNDAGVSPDERRAQLADTFGVEHSNELTTTQASAYLDERVVEVDADGVILDEDGPLTPDQVKRDMDHIRKLAAECETSSDLKRAWGSAYRMFGDNDEVVGIFAARKAELQAAKQPTQQPEYAVE